MLLIETHMHNCEVSPCARAYAADIPLVYQNAGYNALAVTNHYSPYAFSFLDGITSIEKAKNFLRLSRLLIDQAEKCGLKAFLSMEVTLARYQWQDYLIYGDIEKGVLENPELYTYTQARLFDLAAKYEWAVFQAHPFRNGCTLGIPRFMHGIEVYNGVHNSKEVFDRSINFAKKNNLKMSSGGDFHYFGDEGKAGIFIPDGIDNEKQLALYLINNQPELFMINKY